MVENKIKRWKKGKREAKHYSNEKEIKSAWKKKKQGGKKEDKMKDEGIKEQIKKNDK